MLKHVLNGSFGDDIYVLQFSRSIQSHSLCVSYSDKVIRSYHIGEGSINHINDLIGHHGAITDHTFSLNDSLDSFFSSSMDGSILEWDIRAAKQVSGYYREEALTTVSVSGALIAAGDEIGNIHLWDRRNNDPLKSFEQIHSSTVTKIQFYNSELLLTASDDGMMSVFDFSDGLDEDDAFKAGQNMDPVLDFGFFGLEQSKIWCQNGQNGLVLWKWKEALNEESPGGEAPYFICQDIRPMLQVESSITCFPSSHSGALIFAGGSINGDVGLFTFNEETYNFGDAVIQLKQGHNDLVRCCIPWSKDSWLTGGEDCRICLWTNNHPINLQSSPLCIKKKEQSRITPY